MITSIQSHFPSAELSNDTLAQLYPNWTAEKIFQKTGVRKRYVAAEGECASDLAFHAGEKLLSNEDRTKVDFLLFSSQALDYIMPTTACVLQDRLRLSTRCGALDIPHGCAGYIYGLALAQGLLQSNIARNILFLTGETYSRLVHIQDKSTRTIFGDGAAATLLSVESKRRLSSFVLGTDGSGAQEIIIKAGGARLEKSEATASLLTDKSGNLYSDNCLRMNGPEVFNFLLKSVPNLIASILAQANLRLDEIDYFIFHQANAYILEHLRQKIGIPKEKFAICMENSGNTGSATIPIALEWALAQGKIKSGNKVLLAAFGVGFSWGGCILEWNS